MDNKQNELDKLKSRLKEIEPILNKAFKTSEQLNHHVEQNKEVYNEGKVIYERIQQLEWELMSPEEQEREEEVLKRMKLKREGKIL